MINQSGGINLSNLGANAGALGSIANFVGGMTGGGSTGSASASSFNVGDVFSNLLTGFVGNRFASRRISKRSVDTDLAELDPVANSEKELAYVKKSSSKKRNLNSEMETVTEIEVKPKETLTTERDIADLIKDMEDSEEIFAEDEDEAEAKHDTVNINLVTNSTDLKVIKVEDESLEGRIVNNQEELPGLPEGRIINKKRLNAVHFPSPNSIRHEKNIKFVDIQHLNPAPYVQNDVLLFQSNDLYNPQQPFNQAFSFPVVTGNRGSKRIKFEHKEQQQDDRFQTYNVPVDRIKMVFPDRTGTGNLRFDNQDFEVKPVRFGRILSGTRTQNYDNNDYTNNYQSPVNGNRNDYLDTRYQPENNNNNYNSNTKYNKRYESLYNNPNYQSNTQSFSSTTSNRYQRPSSSSNHQSDPNNVYVTNSKGVVEYYINAAGTKVYI